MARVNRFIFNSDFMTVAHVAHEEVTLTIPAKDIPAGSAVYWGEVYTEAKVPQNCFARLRVKYVGQFGTVDVGSNGVFSIQHQKNGKTILYAGDIRLEEGKVCLSYSVYNRTDTTAILADAQTVTIIIDFLKQPNT